MAATYGINMYGEGGNVSGSGIGADIGNMPP